MLSSQFAKFKHFLLGFVCLDQAWPHPPNPVSADVLSFPTIWTQFLAVLCTSNCNYDLLIHVPSANWACLPQQFCWNCFVYFEVNTSFIVKMHRAEFVGQACSWYWGGSQETRTGTQNSDWCILSLFWELKGLSLTHIHSVHSVICKKNVATKCAIISIEKMYAFVWNVQPMFANALQNSPYHKYDFLECT